MIWSRLKDYMCPKCRRGLRKTCQIHTGKEGHGCACGFFISLEAFDKLINRIYQAKGRAIKVDSFEELQNMGREEIFPNNG